MPSPTVLALIIGEGRWSRGMPPTRATPPDRSEGFPKTLAEPDRPVAHPAQITLRGEALRPAAVTAAAINPAVTVAIVEVGGEILEVAPRADPTFVKLTLRKILWTRVVSGTKRAPTAKVKIAALGSAKAVITTAPRMTLATIDPIAPIQNTKILLPRRNTSMRLGPAARRRWYPRAGPPVVLRRRTRSTIRRKKSDYAQWK